MLCESVVLYPSIFNATSSASEERENVFGSWENLIAMPCCVSGNSDNRQSNTNTRDSVGSNARVPTSESESRSARNAHFASSERD